MRKRALLVLIAVGVVAAAIIVTVLIRQRTPPQAMRLLPAADGYVYLDLGLLRAGAGLGKLPQVELDPEYAEFVKETGFQFERDLDEAAFAVHLPPPEQANPGEAPPNRYSEVFVCRFDQGKLNGYLHRLASTEDKYRDTTIYAIPLPGRTVRVAILNRTMVAASNTEGPYVIQGIIDRAHEVGGSTPELLRAYYRRVPLGSVAWGIGRPATPGQQRNSVFALPGGFDLFFPPETVMVASVRYVGSIGLRAEAIAPNEDAARRVYDQLSAFLALFRTIEARAGGSDRDVKEFFDSFQVSRQKNVTTVTATVPPGFAKKILAEVPASVAPEPALAPKAAPAPKKRAR